MEGPNPRSIGDRARQFREHFAVPLDPAGVRDAAVLFLVGPIEITASALGDFDDRVVVFPLDLRNQVVHAPRPHFQTGIGQRAFRGHPRAETRVRIAPSR